MKQPLQNALYLTDAYKLGHADQYPEGTELVYSNFTPRSLAHSPIPQKYCDGKIVVFGLTGVLRNLVDYWDTTFFNAADIDDTIDTFLNDIKPFTGSGVMSRERLVYLHSLGYLPIEVRGLPEGTRTYPKVPHFTIKNTDPKCFWLTNYLETVLSAESWKPSTIATIANAYKRVLTKYAFETGTDTNFVDVQAHDFSSRGLSGYSDMGPVGAAHLTSFIGTDTLASIPYLNTYYDAGEFLKGCSVPATEHSVMCIGGENDELNTFKRLITETYPTGIVSIVSDTWDFWKVITDYSRLLKSDILQREPDRNGMQGKLVFRPDSGSPEDIICGTAIPLDTTLQLTTTTLENLYAVNKSDTVYVLRTSYFTITRTRGKQGFLYSVTPVVTVTPEMKGAVECLWDVFQGTVTSTGHKLLDTHVGLIYGDSITLPRADTILSRLSLKGFASGNVVLGIGAYSYQYITRDTFGFAMKATYGVVNGVPRDIYKKPKTGGNLKHSAKGLLYVSKTADGDYLLTDEVTPVVENTGELRLVFKDGVFYNTATLDSVRNNINKD